MPRIESSKGSKAENDAHVLEIRCLVCIRSCNGTFHIVYIGVCKFQLMFALNLYRDKSSLVK